MSTAAVLAEAEAAEAAFVPERHLPQERSFVSFTEEDARQAVPWLKAIYKYTLAEEQLEAPAMDAIMEQHLINLANNPSNQLLSVAQGGEIIGVIGVLHQNPIDQSAELLALADPKVRGTGTGWKILTYLLERLTPVPFKRLRMFTHEDNAEVIRLCEKAGFEKVDIDIVQLEYTAEESDG